MTGFKGKGRIAVAVKDQRPLVISGDKETTYIGRHFVGNRDPKPIFTRSGRSVAEDISELIANAISNNGFQAERVYVGVKEELSFENDSLAFQEYDRTILLAIDQLEVETLFGLELKWSFFYENL